MHADDATVIADNRKTATEKLKSLLYYCNLNSILPQYDKCEFITINGDIDDNLPLTFGSRFIQNVNYITLLGSHLSQDGSLKEDISLHMKKRYSSCIKFYNFIRSNKGAPISVKIKVLKSCVLGSLLYNCETFGNVIPKELESLYIKLIKSAFGVRPNTPTLLLYIESNFLPLKALVYSRQLKYYRRFMQCLPEGSSRKNLLNKLGINPSPYLKHYITLNEKYDNCNDIFTEYKDIMKNKIWKLSNERHYKYEIYAKLNPDLSAPRDLLHSLHPIASDIIRFRLGSHNLPIEIGRWNRIPRCQRMCLTCNTIGDEEHALFDCDMVDRSGLILSRNIAEIWSQDDIFKLFIKLKDEKII